MADTVSMPKLGFDMAEGTLVRWVKAEGEAVVKGDVLAEIETDKATVEVESPYSGVVARHLVDEKAIVPVGVAIAIIAAPGEKVEVGEPEKAEKATPAAAAPASPVAPAPVARVEVAAGPVKASPLARKMAMDVGVSLDTIKGSGPGGRVVRKDIEAALAATPSQVAGTPASQPLPTTPLVKAAQPEPRLQASLPLSGFTVGEIPPDQRIPLERLRAAIGRRMVESRQQIPHFYVTHAYDMAGLMDLRKRANEMLPDDQKLSVNDFIVKAVALTLRQFPNLNASIQGNEIVHHGHVNVGVAVAVESGLLTVVCKDADRKSLRIISQEIKDMVARARAGKVRPEDIEGSTFSISNLGMFDVEHFVAIINPPEAAILAVGSVKQEAVVVNGELAVGMRMRATLSADHRITDGAEAAQFMQQLAMFLEKPVGLLL